jgi:hypothetical protein
MTIDLHTNTSVFTRYIQEAFQVICKHYNATPGRVVEDGNPQIVNAPKGFKEDLENELVSYLEDFAQVPARYCWDENSQVAYVNEDGRLTAIGHQVNEIRKFRFYAFCHLVRSSLF